MQWAQPRGLFVSSVQILEVAFSRGRQWKLSPLLSFLSSPVFIPSPPTLSALISARWLSLTLSLWSECVITVLFPCRVYERSLRLTRRGESTLATWKHSFIISAASSFFFFLVKLQCLGCFTSCGEISKAATNCYVCLPNLFIFSHDFVFSPPVLNQFYT